MGGGKLPITVYNIKKHKIEIYSISMNCPLFPYNKRFPATIIFFISALANSSKIRLFFLYKKNPFMLYDHKRKGVSLYSNFTCTHYFPHQISQFTQTSLCWINFPSIILPSFRVAGKRTNIDVCNTMQLYHHPCSLDSQKVRLILEEKNVDYTSFHVNPITGKNFESGFFRKNPSAKLPVFQNGSHILYDTIEIIQYIERIAMVSSGGEDSSLSSGEIVEWIYKIQKWNPKYFTLSHIPSKYRLTVSKFLRGVIIARMAECPELASAYHRKLKEAYETEEKLGDPQVVRRSEEHLERILDEAERKLSEGTYLVGEEFSLADIVFIPVLSRLVVLNLEEKYIHTRPNIAEYWNLVQRRPSYRKVIGRYFDGWRRHKTLLKIWCFVKFRSLLKQY